MRVVILAALFLAAAQGASSRSLRKTMPHEFITSSNLSSTPVLEDDVLIKQLRKKLTKLAGGMAQLLGGKVGAGGLAFRGTLAGSMFSKVETELRTVLKVTENATNRTKALQQLQEANGAIQQMSKDLADTQQDLVNENDVQVQSLLLSVLMQKQTESRDKQLEILLDRQFRRLPVVAAVLAAKDTKTPLFQQVAAYLDAHAPKSSDDKIPDKLTKGKDGKPDTAPIVHALEVRLRKMETSLRHAQEAHQEYTTAFDRMLEKDKNQTRLGGYVTAKKKKTDRGFAKQVAVIKNDIKSVQFAIESIKKGDLKGLAQAQDALTKSMKATEARSRHIVYLVQLVNHVDTHDCPYCAAQCIEKCHNEDGKPYSTCLTVCADAGHAS